MAGVFVSERLPEFLGALAHRHYHYARYNCFHMLNDWIVCATGCDPMAPYRDRCSSVAQARALLRDGGGTAALASAALAALGATEIATPAGGDVALVLAPIEERGRVTWSETCAVCVRPGKFAVLTSDLGLVIAPMKLLRAWSLATVAGHR